MNTRVLSGMRPTGNLHLGNYFGAIKQFLDLQEKGEDCFFFVADIHALTEVAAPTQVDMFSVEVAKNYLACGIDPNKSTLYRQSDVPQVSEIATLLGMVPTIAELRRCTTYKGKRDLLVTRALRIMGKREDEIAAILKAKEERTILGNEKLYEIENGFSYGLLGYPVLMAADILCVKAENVPVGEDQTQHVEMARDLARTFNQMFDKKVFAIPELNVSNPLRVPGIDGASKMGKSEGNTIALLEGDASAIRKIKSIPTQIEPGGPMEPGTQALYDLVQLCSPLDIHTDYLRRYTNRQGKFFGEMKQRLADDVLALLQPIKDRYSRLSNDDVRDILAQGATKVRRIAASVLADMQCAMGLRLTPSSTS